MEENKIVIWSGSGSLVLVFDPDYAGSSLADWTLLESLYGILG